MTAIRGAAKQPIVQRAAGSDNQVHIFDAERAKESARLVARQPSWAEFVSNPRASHVLVDWTAPRHEQRFRPKVVWIEPSPSDLYTIDHGEIVVGLHAFHASPNSAATPEPSDIRDLRSKLARELQLRQADATARKFASFLEDLARKAEMPVTETRVWRRDFLSDGETRIFVRQFISRSPEDVVDYAVSVSDDIDAWVERLPSTERDCFEDDIVVNIHWA